MNIDDIIIRPKTSNFLELLEQNINNQNYQTTNNSNKLIRKYTPPQKKLINLTFPQKNEIKKYRYYTDNFKKKKKILNEENDEKKQKKEIKELNKPIMEEDKVRFKKGMINDFFSKNNLDNNKLQKLINEENMNSNLNKKNDYLEIKINQPNSLLNNANNRDINISIEKKDESNKNLKIDNNEKKINYNQIDINSSINNLKGFLNQNLKNCSSNSNQSINYKNISSNIPHEESMQNDINYILNLNNNIDSTKKQFNTIQNMKHSQSTKSFAFRKRIKPQNKSSQNHFAPDEIINILEREKNLSNKKNDMEEKNIKKLQIKISILKEEYEKIKKEKINYENLIRVMQNDKRNFYKQIEFDIENFEQYKNNEIKKLANERNKIFYESQQINELKRKYQEYVNKDNENEINIFKNLIKEANNKIIQLKNYLKKLEQNNIDKKKYHNKTIKNEIENNKVNLDEYDESEDNDDDNYDLIFPPKFHNIKYNLIKTHNDSDGKIKNIYDKNKIEIISNDGEKKEIYNDIYEITYFGNGDIKQIFKDQKKQVHFLKNRKIIKTTLEKGLEIIKYENGKLEKNFINGTRKISLPDGSLKYIFLNGLEETYYPDGSVERLDKEGNIILEHEDGTKELIRNFNKNSNLPKIKNKLF